MKSWKAEIRLMDFKHLCPPYYYYSAHIVGSLLTPGRISMNEGIATHEGSGISLTFPQCLAHRRVSKNIFDQRSPEMNDVHHTLPKFQTISYMNIN